MTTQTNPDARLSPPTLPLANRLARLPYWAIAAVLLGVLITWHFVTDETYSEVLSVLTRGILVTIWVTAISYTLAVLLGLVVALGKVSRSPVLYQIATFYVEIIRGVPTLVLLLWIAFVGFPIIVSGLNAAGNWLASQNLTGGVTTWMATLRPRDVDNGLRAIVALVISYSAFIAEIFRSGIESIDRGQIEAARALGMTHWQAMWHVVLRQAIRRVLPPLGNDLIAMLKDSSLVSALGVADITGTGRVYQAQSYLVIQTYNVVAFLYLTMTLLLSVFVKWLEQYTARELKRMDVTQSSVK